jgi:hypothetical protein
MKTSPFKGIVYYLKPIRAVAEKDAEFQMNIKWISEIKEGVEPTNEDIIHAAPPDCTGAIFAYLTYN